MTSLERAQRFLNNKACKLALTATPLAALAAIALPAKAGPIQPLSFNSATCNTSTTNASFAGSGCSSSTLPTMTNGVNGLHLIGDLTATATNSGGSFSLSMTWGPGSTNAGSFNGTIPLNFDFFVYTSQSATFNYTLDYFFIGAGGVTRHEFSNGIGTNSMGSEVVGSDSALLRGQVSAWEAVLNVTVSNDTQGETLRVLVPDSSIDINAAQGVPEPASLVLFAPGLGYLILRRRRKSA